MAKKTSDEHEGRKALLELLLRNTVVLMRIDERGRGSGVVIPWNGGLRVVTARHVIEKGEWGVEAGNAVRGQHTPPLTERTWMTVPFEDRQTLLLRLRADAASLDAVAHDIAWAHLDFDRDALAEETRARSALLPHYRGPLDLEPSEGEIFAFAGVNRDELHEGSRTIRREVSWESEMTFIGSDPSALRFKLARPHQGHAYYKGASGAPVADRTGAIVGVLAAPDVEEDVLRVGGLKTFIDAMRAIEAKQAP